MTELMTAKEALAKTNEYRKNEKVKKSIEKIQQEITEAVTRGQTSVNTRVIVGIKGLKDYAVQELIIEKLQSAGYRVSKETTGDSRDPYHGQEEEVHLIDWS